MSLLLFLLRASRGLLAAAFASSVLSGLGGAALVATINQALSAERQALSALGVRFAGLSLAVLALRWLSKTLFVRLSQSTLARLRLQISRQVADCAFRHLEVQGGARMTAVLTEDVASVSQFFVALPELVMHGAVVLGCLLYLGSLSGQVFVFALAITVLGGLGYHLVHLQAIKHLQGARRREDDLFRHFRALFDGAKELRLHRNRKRVFLSDVLTGEVNEVRRLRTRGLTIYVGAESWGSFLFFFFIGAVLFVFGRLFSVSTHVLSGYALVFLYMMLPVEAVLMAIPELSRARIALDRISEVTGTLTQVEAGASAEAPRTFRSLRLRQVTHHYRREGLDETFVLGPLDLEFRAGEVVFLVGGNGSGKTTLAKVLVGLYPPQGGEILLDGAIVTSAERPGYRELFSAVFSDFFLFDRLLGLEDADLDERGSTLLRELQLDRKVTLEAGAFSTTELSHGQRKRLALLVACLEDRPFYVFDEWAADQDPAYKEIFYRRLVPELKARGKTVLVITHDDRYFGLADRLIKLELGQVMSQEGRLQLPTERPARALDVGCT